MDINCKTAQISRVEKSTQGWTHVLVKSNKLCSSSALQYAFFPPNSLSIVAKCTFLHLLWKPSIPGATIPLTFFSLKTTLDAQVITLLGTRIYSKTISSSKHIQLIPIFYTVTKHVCSSVLIFISCSHMLFLYIFGTTHCGRTDKKCQICL